MKAGRCVGSYLNPATDDSGLDRTDSSASGEMHDE